MNYYNVYVDGAGVNLYTPDGTTITTTTGAVDSSTRQGNVNRGKRKAVKFIIKVL